ncbi:MAG: hypothetical protein QNK23_12210 [Crocinitomicaceae bacterium]|nr:hypothetical protein [Crocinitomicaceae bacterium]
MTHHYDHTTVLGTITGTLFSVAATIDVGDIVKTIVLAALGALVSFGVSSILKWIKKKLRKRSN